MRFLFVDRITQISARHIAGEKRFSLAEPMRFTDANGRIRLRQGLVAEAIGQLASWLALKENDFSGRPVFLFADAIHVRLPVGLGEKVLLESQVDQMDEESFRFSGRAFVKGQLVQEIRDCSGYFMPLDKLEDPERCRQRFASLTSGGLLLDGCEGNAYEMQSFIKDYAENEGGVLAQIAIPEDAPFFADHFPRFPVTPIVVLNELISLVASRFLTKSEITKLVPESITSIKIKSFVRPGEEFAVKLRLDSGPVEQRHDIRAELLRRGKPFLRGRYAYEKAVGGIR